MRGIGRIGTAQPDRPGALLRFGDGGDIEAGNGARRRRLVGQQVALDDLLGGDQAFLRGMRHQHQLAPHADPDIALAVGLADMEQRHIRLDRRHQQDGVVLAERIVRHLPVIAVRDQVAAQHAAQRHVGDALLRRLQPSMDGGTGAIPKLDQTGLGGGDEARGDAKLAHGHGRGLQRADATGADQHVALQPHRGHADNVQILCPAPDQRAHHLHGAAGIIRRQGDLGPVGDALGQLFDGE